MRILHLFYRHHVTKKITEYTETMRCTLGDAPTTSWDDVKGLLEREFDAPVESIFEHIEKHPCSSASLAQVHRAVLRDGSSVAVKVQHPGLAETSAADIWLVSSLVRLGSMMFSSFDFEWLTDEVREM